MALGVSPWKKRTNTNEPRMGRHIECGTVWLYRPCRGSNMHRVN